jgi:hypothetical protein
MAWVEQGTFRSALRLSRIDNSLIARDLIERRPDHAVIEAPHICVKEFFERQVRGITGSA